MTNATDATNTATLRAAITDEMRKRGLSPALARSAAALMLEGAKAHPTDAGDTFVAMDGRVFPVDSAVSRWFAGEGRELAPVAQPAPLAPARETHAQRAPSFDLDTTDGAVDAALYLLNAAQPAGKARP